MNFDIGGGGTTNVAIYKKNGDVVDSACFDIGGRLVKVDQAGTVTYMSKKMKALCAHLNIDLKIGQKLQGHVLKQITDTMAKAIVLIATHQTQDPVYKLLITDHGLTFEGNIDAVCLSGGVADCIRKTTDEDFPYGDIGVKLGQSIHEILGESDLVVEKAIETIRATVVGAGSHTTDVSGSTIRFDASVLPIKNIPVIRLSAEEEKMAGQGRVDAIKKREWTGLKDKVVVNLWPFLLWGASRLDLTTCKSWLKTSSRVWKA